MNREFVTPVSATGFCIYPLEVFTFAIMSSGSRVLLLSEVEDCISFMWSLMRSSGFCPSPVRGGLEHPFEGPGRVRPPAKRPFLDPLVVISFVLPFIPARSTHNALKAQRKTWTREEGNCAPPKSYYRAGISPRLSDSPPPPCQHTPIL